LTQDEVQMIRILILLETLYPNASYPAAFHRTWTAQLTAVDDERTEALARVHQAKLKLQQNAGTWLLLNNDLFTA